MPFTRLSKKQLGYILKSIGPKTDSYRRCSTFFRRIFQVLQVTFANLIFGPRGFNIWAAVNSFKMMFAGCLYVEKALNGVYYEHLI